MPEIHVRVKEQQPLLEDELALFAKQWELELQQIEGGYHLLPEIMLERFKPYSGFL